MQSLCAYPERAAMNTNHKPSAEHLGLLAMNLKRLRKARGYTQRQLGKLSGLNRNYISNIERETVNISLANLERLANALECSLYDLFAPIAPKGR
jgi:transcriptional regulator with XRE-family HTH domain